MAQRQFRSDDTSTWTDKYGDGSAGAFTASAGTDTTPNTTLIQGADSTHATVGSGTGFANGDLVLIHQTQGTGKDNWELNKITSGGGTTAWVMAYAMIQAYATGAQVYKLFKYSSATIGNGVNVTGVSWNASNGVGGIYALLVNGTLSISGNTLANGIGFRGKTPGSSDNTQPNYNGEGDSGASTLSLSANGNGGGGGGFASSNNQAGAGAGGGNATVGGAGTNGNGSGTPTGGTGGSAAGNSDLTLVALGGAGGDGGANVNGAPATVASNGGGFVLLIARNFVVTGGINANGNNVSDNNNANTGGSGAGAGGSILIKGETITLGNNLITAQKGLASATNTGGGVRGGDGSDGRIHVDWATSLNGTTLPAFTSRQDSTLIASKNLILAETITLVSHIGKTFKLVLTEVIQLKSVISITKNLITWIKQPRPPVKP